MPTLPWSTVNSPPPNAEAVVVASRPEVRSLADVPRFFLKSLAAWKQARSAPGAYGVALFAQPSRRTFRTLSAWEDQQAVYAYAKAEPHRSVVIGLRSTMSRSVFTFSKVPAAELPIDWPDARRRPAGQERRDARTADGPATAVCPVPPPTGRPRDRQVPSYSRAAAGSPASRRSAARVGPSVMSRKI
ncbi:DUF3291 domain-containing protein [Streptomyces sp. NPDC003480]